MDSGIAAGSVLVNNVVHAYGASQPHSSAAICHNLTGQQSASFKVKKKNLLSLSRESSDGAKISVEFTNGEILDLK